MQSFPRRLLVIRPVTDPSIPCIAPPRISTPASVGPTVGANCHGKVTADIRRVELNMGPLLRGDFGERVDMARDSAIYLGFSPSLSRGKSLLMLLIIMGSDPRKKSRLIDYKRDGRELSLDEI